MPFVIVFEAEEPKKFGALDFCCLQEDFNKKPFYSGAGAIRIEKQTKIKDYEHECIAGDKSDVRREYHD